MEMAAFLLEQTAASGEIWIGTEREILKLIYTVGPIQISQHPL